MYVQNLFTELDIEMSEERQDMLLAICDIDGSGEIDQEVWLIHSCSLQFF